MTTYKNFFYWGVNDVRRNLAAALAAYQQRYQALPPSAAIHPTQIDAAAQFLKETGSAIKLIPNTGPGTNGVWLELA